MSCTRRRNLEQRYENARADLDATRKRLRDRIASCPKGEFLSLADDLDRSEEMVDYTRALLDNHLRHHHCGAQEETAVDAENRVAHHASTLAGD